MSLFSQFGLFLAMQDPLWLSLLNLFRPAGYSSHFIPSFFPGAFPVLSQCSFLNSYSFMFPGGGDGRKGTYWKDISQIPNPFPPWIHHVFLQQRGISASLACTCVMAWHILSCITVLFCMCLSSSWLLSLYLIHYAFRVLISVLGTHLLFSSRQPLSCCWAACSSCALS